MHPPAAAWLGDGALGATTPTWAKYQPPGLEYQRLQASPTEAALRALKSSTATQLQREAAPLAQVPVGLWKPAPPAPSPKTSAPSISPTYLPPMYV